MYVCAPLAINTGEGQERASESQELEFYMITAKPWALGNKPHLQEELLSHLSSLRKLITGGGQLREPSRGIPGSCLSHALGQGEVSRFNGSGPDDAR